MFNFDVGVQTEHRYMQNYEVFCNHCGHTLGVMHYCIIRDAILATLGRGGVLCPDCRKATCDICGKRALQPKMVEGPMGEVRLCDSCEASWEIMKVNIHEGIINIEVEEEVGESEIPL